MRLHHWLFGLFLALLPVQLGYHFWPPWSYVLGLRVDYLSPTVFFTDILVVLILLCWMFDSSRVNQLRVTSYELKKHWWVLAIFIFFLVNSLFAQNQGAALYKFFKVLEFALLGFYVAKNNFVSRLTSYVLPVTVLYSSLIAFAQFLKQSSLGGIFWYLGERTFNSGTPGIAKIALGGRLLMRPYATFPHPNVLAGFVLISLMLTFPYLIKKNRILGVCYLLFSIGCLAITFSRSVLLVGVFFGLYCLAKRTKKLVFFWFLLMIFAGAIFVFGKTVISQESFYQRWELGRASLLMIKENPLVGMGLNNFIPKIPIFWQNLSAVYWLQPVHNIYLLVSAETGLVGLLIFLWFLFLTYKRLMISHSLLITSLTAILLLGFFDHYWLTLQQTQLLFGIVLGFAWGYTQTQA